MARNKMGVGHDGRMNALSRPGEATHDVHHTPALARGMEAQQHTTATLGKPPKAKGYAVPVHANMHTRNRTSGEFVLGGHLASYDANPANPLNAGPPAGKRLAPVQPVPGQRSRTSDCVGGSEPGLNHQRGRPDVAALRELGAQVMAEAFAASAPDDRAAHGYGIGRLPPVTIED